MFLKPLGETVSVKEVLAIANFDSILWFNWTETDNTLKIWKIVPLLTSFTTDLARKYIISGGSGKEIVDFPC